MAKSVIMTTAGPVSAPCMEPELLPLDVIEPNTYNPNHMDSGRLRALRNNIRTVGFRYPIVVMPMQNGERYVIIDGYHRYRAMRDIGAESIPATVLHVTSSERIIATVLFNRTRGVHQVDDMGNIVRILTTEGLREDEIARRLDMDMDEVLRLQQVSGIAGMFADSPYSRSWEPYEEQ